MPRISQQILFGFDGAVCGHNATLDLAAPASMKKKFSGGIVTRTAVFEDLPKVYMQS